MICFGVEKQRAKRFPLVTGENVSLAGWSRSTFCKCSNTDLILPSWRDITKLVISTWSHNINVTRMTGRVVLWEARGTVGNFIAKNYTISILLRNFMPLDFHTPISVDLQVVNVRLSDGSCK